MTLNRYALLLLAALAWYAWTRRHLVDPRTASIRTLPALSERRLVEFAALDPVCASGATDAMREFSRLYQESFLVDAEPCRVARRMHDARAAFAREANGLRLWLPNDAPAERRLVAFAEETDATMAHMLADVAHRRDVRGMEPRAGRLRFQDHLGVRAVDDEWI